jgi:hypothetical protein
MASSGKRKTTMAKLNRERRLLDKRHAKQARKEARKRAAALEKEGDAMEAPSAAAASDAPEDPPPGA